MVAIKFSLDKIRQKYNSFGKSLKSLIQDILSTNNTSYAKNTGNKVSSYFEKIAPDTTKRIQISHPSAVTTPYVAPSKTKKLLIPDMAQVMDRDDVFIRKSKEHGESITQTLKDDLTTALQDTLFKDKQVMAVRGVHSGRLRPDIEKVFQDKITNVFENYTKDDPSLGMPKNIHTIAVTELRTTTNIAKDTYAREFLSVNPDLEMEKRWIHNPKLSKKPRSNHAQILKSYIGFNEDFHFLDKDGKSVTAKHPHDPKLPLYEVIGCHCELDYRIKRKGVDKMRVNCNVHKSLMIGSRLHQFINSCSILEGEYEIKDNGRLMVMKAKKPSVPIGSIVTRPDGSRWKKTSTFGYSKVDDGDGSTTTTNPVDNPNEETIIGGKKVRGIDDLDAVMLKYGEKGMYQMNKYEFDRWLDSHGIDVSGMRYADKVNVFKNKYKEIEKTLKEKEKEEHAKDHVAISTEPYQCYNIGIKYDDGETLELDENAWEMFREEYKHASIAGGHWGSANTNNPVALAVAVVNSQTYKPFDSRAGKLIQDFKKHVPEDIVETGMGLRNYAQEQIQKFSREEYPNVFRGQTIDMDTFIKVIDGEIDTLELTGCTAGTFYEKIADKYSASSWTKGFGGDRQSVKLVIERDDAFDNSIGMWHHAYGGKDKPAFEFLTGAGYLKINKVDVKKKQSLKEEHEKSLAKAEKEIMSEVKSIQGLKNVSNLGEFDEMSRFDDKIDDIFGKTSSFFEANKILHGESISSDSELQDRVDKWRTEFKEKYGVPYNRDIASKMRYIRNMKAFSRHDEIKDIQKDVKWMESFKKRGIQPNTSRESGAMDNILEYIANHPSESKNDVIEWALNLVNSFFSQESKDIYSNLDFVGGIYDAYEDISKEIYGGDRARTPKVRPYNIRGMEKWQKFSNYDQPRIKGRAVIHCKVGKGKKSFSDDGEGIDEELQKCM